MDFVSDEICDKMFEVLKDYEKERLNILFFIMCETSVSTPRLIGKLLDCGLVDIEVKNDSGRTPLMEAVNSSNIKAVSELLERAANFKTRDKKHLNSLMIAAMRGNFEIIKMLLDYGASPEEMDLANIINFFSLISDDSVREKTREYINSRNLHVKPAKKDNNF